MTTLAEEVEAYYRAHIIGNDEHIVQWDGLRAPDERDDELNRAIFEELKKLREQALRKAALLYAANLDK